MLALRPHRPPSSYLSIVNAQRIKSASANPPALIYNCSSCSQLDFSPTISRQAQSFKEKRHKTWGQDQKPAFEQVASDHRAIGLRQSLWTLHQTSPGSPIFTPDGTYIFQKLQAFLRAQYPAFGFQEVLTPTIYKQSLWERSGHWENYKDDMFIVDSSKNQKALQTQTYTVNGIQATKPLDDDHVETKFGLKPMNCPGHCILFASKIRSYNDLPIRYADFSPLHRDEISGALSGLTRVRRFHQDDGHIFCRPRQVKGEIAKSIQLMEMVYKVLGIKNYRLVISTRPKTDFIGTEEDWERAEAQLVEALQQGSSRRFSYSKGDGAFYGPKIDAITVDGAGKEHQIGTIQLDFQMPKRFNLNYVAPSPEKEVKGEEVDTEEGRKQTGPVAPVMIHRAVLGSLERFMAILMENHKGKWPFWLNPNPVVVLTVTDNPRVKTYGEHIVDQLGNPESDFTLPRRLNLPYFKVDLDTRNESIAKKIALAREKGYAIIVIVGERNAKANDADVIVSNILDQRRVWDTMEKVKPGSQAPVQRDRGVGTSIKGNPGLRLELKQLQEVMQILTDQYI